MWHNLGNTLDVLGDLNTIFEGEIGYRFIGCDGLVGEYSNRNFSVFCSLANDIEVSGVDDVNAETYVYFFLHRRKNK